ncbi:cystathionine beta-lyase [Bellilinea caldifistulae]|uniref:trans-sulfuration enzyme family protein n=1 Tax=Bellilinea caldifistulae TaxID=360411 RepID=UPI0009E3E71A|nr:aminotransferase class I/II-fold pyridoxal phosphate-dependent enzyme [Bellilinea caldifistulae]GAP08935.1 cystathionine beta-lyase [Bellilinea caldifistulae]
MTQTVPLSTLIDLLNRQPDPESWGDSTRAIHAGSQREKPYHAIIEPLVQTATYTFRNSEEVIAYQDAHSRGLPTDRLEYGRYGNPTIAACEARLAALEGAETAIQFASGMAAITTTLLACLRSGDHLVMTDDCYRRTRQICLEFLARFDIQTSVVPIGDYAALEDAIRPNTRLLLSETPTNPYLRVLDLERFSEIAHRHRLISVVDTTFATPFNQRPLDWGVDIVIHSATKYLGGHNDLLAGFAAGSAAALTPVRELHNILGATADPHNAYLLLRGIKTLSIRLGRHNENGQRVAEFLESHPAVEQVWYPGLPSHPDYAVASAQMKGFGGVVSFTVRGGLYDTARFIDRLQIPYISPSLGGTESLVIQPALMSYYDVPPEKRQALGIRDNLVRLSLGLEDADDLIADLKQALEAL